MTKHFLTLLGRYASIAIKRPVEREFVAQSFTLPYRRFSIGSGWTFSGPRGLEPARRMQFCDTADFKSALRGYLAVGIGVLLTLAVQAAPLQTEAEALAALQSAGTAADKEAACRRLKEVGSAKAVPALKALLADESLAQWAVDALQTLPAREAGEALLKALPETSGKTKALVVFALGNRREAAAVPPLAKLASDSDAVIAGAATKALGQIGNEAALSALRTLRAQTSGPLRTVVNDSLLAVADGFRAKGDLAKARSLYAELRGPNEPAQLRAAIFRGLALSGGGANAIASALVGTNETEQVCAVQLVREFPEASATKTFAEALPKLAPRVQLAVLEALRQRDDPAAADAVAALVRSGDAAVRVAAFKALGELGGASHVGLLGELAARGAGNERSEALLALVALHRGDVTSAILSEIPQAKPEAKLELIQVLASRMDRAAVPSLLRFAAGEDMRLGVASARALEKVADVSQMPALLELILRAKDEARRDAAVSAFAAVGGRSREPADFSPLALNALANASPETRCALLEAAGQLGGAEVAPALRLALRDANADIRTAAARVMAEYAGDEARPDLLKLAQECKIEADRAMALAGYWRLVEAMAGRSQAERFAAVQAGLALTGTPGEKKLGLARLSELQSGEALDVALRYRDDTAVRGEAEAACLAIASRLEGAELDAAEKALGLLASSGAAERIRNEAKAAVAKLEARKGYLAPWLVSGPYRQEGKQAQQLFDVAFAPESSEPSKARWRALAGAGPTLDLLPVAGGDHCIVYLKTRVFCPKEQSVALEIGTDDGVKLWINGTLVHANNAVRGFTAGQDKAKAELKQGWNDFLVKVTQHTAGCAASVRVMAADGKAIPGLRVEAKE